MTTVTGTMDTVADVTATLSVPQKGETISIALSGTYDMVVGFERAVTPDESAWETVFEYTVEDATVAASYVTQRSNEKFRMRVTTDTSGTVTYTIADGDLLVRHLTDDHGNVLAEYFQSGPRWKQGVVAVTATLTLDPLLHAGRICAVSLGASTVTLTLPAATGSGDRYAVYVVVNATPSSLVITASAAGSDIQGAVPLGDQGLITGVVATPEVADNTITMNGTTTGGALGTYLELVDVAPGVYALLGNISTDGAEADPFSAVYAN